MGKLARQTYYDHGKRFPNVMAAMMSGVQVDLLSPLTQWYIRAPKDIAKGVPADVERAACRYLGVGSISEVQQVTREVPHGGLKGTRTERSAAPRPGSSATSEAEEAARNRRLQNEHLEEQIALKRVKRLTQVGTLIPRSMARLYHTSLDRVHQRLLVETPPAVTSLVRASSTNAEGEDIIRAAISRVLKDGQTELRSLLREALANIPEELVEGGEEEEE